MDVMTIDALMEYLRDVKQIQIDGDVQKKQLRNIGYYHGYKGYRFFYRSNKKLPYADFNELLCVYDFDMRIKACFYPCLMQIETALKNRALEEMLAANGSDSFVSAYQTVLNRHADFPPGSEARSAHLSKELALRSKIYGALSHSFGSKTVVRHFYEQDRPVPLWAIFEIINLGEFGNLLSCVNKDTALKISRSVGIHTAFDADGRLLEKIVYTIKDLRNAVAHNDTVFDVRFKTATPSAQIAKLLMRETCVDAIDFSTVADYVVLLAYLMKRLGFPSVSIARLLSGFEDSCEELRGQVPFALYSMIVHTNVREKLRRLRAFV